MGVRSFARSWGLVLALLGACSLAPAVDGAWAAEGLLDAPYQVEGVLRFRDDRGRGDRGLALGPPQAVVDLGSAQDRAPPRREDFEAMTLIGTAGAVDTGLSDVARSCEFLCGEELQECHYVTRQVPAADFEALGTPLVALPGDQPVEAFARLKPAEVAVALARQLLPPSDSFEALLWSPEAHSAARYRVTHWDPGTAALGLEVRYGDAPVLPIEARGCVTAGYGALASITCNGIALLVAAGRPLLVSYPDYNLAAAEPVVRFEVGRTAYTLVRLGLKAQTVFGLLAETPAGWQARFRPLDYALLC